MPLFGGRGRVFNRRDDSPVVQAEAFRILRTNILAALSEIAQPTVVVTSAYANEGKTSITANLAVSLAMAGKNVGLVDFDLRRPNLHTWFGASNDVGVSDVLLGRRSLAEALQALPVDTGVADVQGGIYLLPTGPSVEKPTEFLTTGDTSYLLDELVEHKADLPNAQTRQIDIVLIDTPPVLPVADALVIGRVTTGAVLVVQAGKTPVGAVQHAKNALIRNQTRLLGVIMNGRSADLEPGFGYGYGYGYGDGEAGLGSPAG
jgi:polysaccharide biosynthesis transport protein